MVKEICTKVKNPHLIVADVKQDVVDRCVNEWSAQGIDIKAGRIEEILFEDVDVVVPCAIGGIFTEENIEQLRCKIIWGSANNQIKASSQEEEIRLAQKIADRGILFQTDWWHNTAGVMFAWEEVWLSEAGRYQVTFTRSSATFFASVSQERTSKNRKSSA